MPPAVGDHGASAVKYTIEKYRPSLEPFEEIYKDIHQNPELSGEEIRTASIAAEYLDSLSSFEVHRNIGGYGVVGLLRNGSGPTVMLRADMDALPHLEMTSLPYASTKIAKDRQGKDTPVMHACRYFLYSTRFEANPYSQDLQAGMICTWLF